MKLILVRHGNTFEADKTPVWVGSRNDLQLTAKGREQAGVFSTWLWANHPRCAQVYCGPLSRTRVFADIVCEHSPHKRCVDPRLAEIDFGSWSGRSDDEIVSSYGQTSLTDWRERGVWPEGMGWTPGEIVIRSEVESFVASLQAAHKSDETVVGVTSNGRLRYFLGLDPAAFSKRLADGGISVKTGNYCELDISSSGVVVKDWNLKPSGSGST